MNKTPGVFDSHSFNDKAILLVKNDTYVNTTTTAPDVLATTPSGNTKRKLFDNTEFVIPMVEPKSAFKSSHKNTIRNEDQKTFLIVFLHQ